MFEAATLKLTGIYLIIIMIISFIFSVQIYRATNDEITNGLMQQVTFLDNTPRFQGILNDPMAIRMREARLDQARSHIIFNLLNINIIILVTGGMASYIMARRTLRPIKRAHEAQARFTADASHELRTPLTAMQTEIEVALRDPDLKKAEAVDLLRSNLEELAKLRALSDGLLQLAKEDGSLVRQPIQTDTIFDQSIKQIAAQAKKKGISIVRSAKKSYTINGNETSLVELFVILLDNAIKYSPKGSKITLHAGMSARRVVMSVRDEGEGIATADLPHIFDRFYRADSSRSKSKTSGHGLGLSIARKIAELHHADLTVKSAPGKGTTFTLAFGSVWPHKV